MMEIKILGTGCKNCQRLQQIVEEAIDELQIDAKVIKVEDVPGIMKYRIMRTPGLVINEKVKAFGRIVKKEEVIQFIKEEEKN